MTPERFRRIEQVFHAVAEAPAGEREALLARLCGADAALRAEVEALLDAHADADERIHRAISREADLTAGAEDPRRIASRYTVLVKLGEGGMGAVYRALDRLTGQHVAIKRVRVAAAIRAQAATLATGASADAAHPLLLALAREFRTLASIRHPHVISVLDYGFEVRGEPFFTMELLSGARPLSRESAGRTREQRIRLLLQVLQALTYVHRRGVLHRDLKPANVLVLGDGDDARVKVLDFGIACVRDQAHDSELAGTIAYMAPELLGGRAPDEATDLWAVAVMAHEVLTGGHPLGAHDPASLVGELRGTGPIFSGDPGLGPALSSVLSRALARSPAERYPDAAAFAHDLARAAGLPPPAETAEIRESFLSAAEFVGRDAELGALLAALDEAAAGRGTTWLVGGESGVGKSRLLDELRTHALVRGMRVVRGQAVSEGGAAYGVWCGALRPLCLGEPLDDLDAGVLRAAVPDIAAVLDPPGRRVPDPPEIDPQHAQARLFQAVERVLAGRRAPLVVLLEDLHWAEPASVALLRHLERAVPRLPLLVIGSYRDDEHAGLPAELPGARRLPLRRLSAGEIASLGASMLGEAGRRPEVVALLERETEGNAFFVVEVMRALAQEAGALARIGVDGVPPRVTAGGVRAVLARRLARVPAAARPLLCAAAVLGRELDLEVLRALPPELAGRVDPDLAAAVSASVLEVSEDRWRFAHDKLREALLEELAAGERAAWHRRIAGAIERAHAADVEPHAAVLAYHLEQAGEPAREAPHRVQAGARALQGGAALDAISHLERADRLLGLVACTPAERARQLGLLGRAYHAARRPEEAVQVVERLLAGAGFPRPRSPLAQAASTAWHLAGHVRSRLRSRPQPPRAGAGRDAFARVLGEVFTATFEDLALTRSPGRVVGTTVEVTAAAERLGDPFVLAPAYTGLGFLVLATPLSVLSDGYFRRARALLDGTPGDRLEVRAHLEMVEACAHVHRGRWEAAVQALGAELDQRRRMGGPPTDSITMAQSCHIALFRGDMARAAEALGRLEELERGLDRAWWVMPLLKNLLAMRRGAFDEAARLVAEMDASFPADAPGGRALIDAYAALCALRRGDGGEARRRADAALEGLIAVPPMTYAFVDAVPAMVEVYAALWSAAAGGAEAAALAARMTRALAILRRFSLVVPIARSSAWLWSGRWAAMRGRGTLARWSLRKALAAAGRYRMPFDEALARRALAEVEEARGERALAAEHRRRARELFERLDAPWHAGAPAAPA